MCMSNECGTLFGRSDTAWGFVPAEIRRDRRSDRWVLTEMSNVEFASEGVAKRGRERKDESPASRHVY